MNPMWIMAALSALQMVAGQEEANRQNEQIREQKAIDKAKSKWAGFQPSWAPDKAVGPEKNTFLAGLAGALGGPGQTAGLMKDVNNLQGYFGGGKPKPAWQDTETGLYWSE